MEAEMIVAGSAIGGNVLLGIGLTFTWMRNGRSAAGKYGALEQKLTDTTETVNAIDGKVDKLVESNGRYDERLNATERDIKDLKAR